MRGLLIILFSCANLAAAVFGALVPAANYYVDQGIGSDSNNGTSTSTPFLTIGHACAVAAAGQLVAVKGGANYRYAEECVAPGVSFSIAGYGPTKPFMDGSDPISAGAWTKTSGLTSVYETAITCDNVNGYLRLWEEPNYLPRATSLANLDATPGSYYVSGDPAGGGQVNFTMYVHPTAGGNPSTNGIVYSFNKRGAALFSQFEKFSASNIRARRALAYYGELKSADYSFASDLLLEDGTVHNAVIGGGGNWQNVDMVNSYTTLGKISVVVNDDHANNLDFTFRRVTYTETIQPGPSFYAHSNMDGIYGQISLVDCTTVGGTSLGGFQSQKMLITGGSFDGGVINMAQPVSIMRNTTVGGYIDIPYAADVELDTVTVAGTSAGTVVLANNTAFGSLNIHGSTLNPAIAFDSLIYVGVGSSIGTLTLQGNTYTGFASGAPTYLGGPGVAGALGNATIDSNTYHYPGNMLFPRVPNYDFSNAGQWAAWQALGYDTHGTRVTP